MTVYEWLMLREDVRVTFDKTTEDDRIKILEIQMDADCECPIIANGDGTWTQFPITVIRTFYDNEIPDNDTVMLDILNQMYQRLIGIINNQKSKNN